MRTALPLLLALVLVAGCAPPPAPPNVVVIVVDDLGWADLGVYGSTFHETPHLDQLAADGVRFTQFYAASPVCSPTRASLMTGKHPARLHLTNWIGGEQNGLLQQADYIRALPLAETTFAEAFQAAGYRTGYLGKWHLGREGFMPDAQGFDSTFAVNQAGQPGAYFPPYRNDNWPVTNVPDLDGDPDSTYLVDRLSEAAVGFLEAYQSDPFLLVLSHYAVHTPLQAPADLTAQYEAKAAALPPLDGESVVADVPYGVTTRRQQHPAYAAMIERVDDSVGRIRAALDRLGLAENTIVVIVSDNGGLSTLSPGRTWMPTSNAPLRAGKGWLYEGGLRIPLLVHWPRRLTAGSLTDQPAMTMDLYPTLLDLAGLPLQPDQHRDGVSLAPLLRDGILPDRDTLYWHFPHYHGSGNRPGSAVRAGDYKLVEWHEDNRVELYHLAIDPSEATDLAAAEPERAAAQHAALHRWRTDVAARMPTPLVP